MVQDLVNKFWCQNSGEEIHIKLWPTPQGNVLPGDDYSKGKILWTRVTWIFVLCREETKK